MAWINRKVCSSFIEEKQFCYLLLVVVTKIFFFNKNIFSKKEIKLDVAVQFCQLNCHIKLKHFMWMW